jgi:hypothetical protein
MSTFAVESLESRTLMSATTTVNADLSAIYADIAAIKAGVPTDATTSAADQHTLAATLAPVSKPNAALLKTLAKGYKTALASLHTLEKIATVLNADTTHTASSLEGTSDKKTLVDVGKLEKEEHLFATTPVFAALSADAASTGTDEVTIGSNNPNNAALTAALPAVEADTAALSTTFDAQGNQLVTDINAFDTEVLNIVSGVAS